MPPPNRPCTAPTSGSGVSWDTGPAAPAPAQSGGSENTPLGRDPYSCPGGTGSETTRRPVAAPGLSLETWPYYEKGAYKVDQFASVRQNARRQRHVDQSISFNLYVPSTIRASTLLDLHLSAWREGLKTTYYVRSNDIDISECEWCSS